MYGFRHKVTTYAAAVSGALMVAAPVVAQERGPLALASASYFFVGGRIDPSVEGSPTVGQMYVEFMIPARRRHPYPIVMVHGGSQTGTNFTGTPDGREGWAQYFVRRGYAVYVVDQVARGRSAHCRRCTERCSRRGSLSSSGASSRPSVSSNGRRRICTRNGRARASPAIQSGPPVHDIENTGAPDWFKMPSARRCRGSPTFRSPMIRPARPRPAVGASSVLEFVRQDTADKPELVRCWLQKEPARQLPRLKHIPVAIIVGEASYHAAYDHCTAAYLTQAGVRNTLIRLADVGVRGNGHMMMLEKNNAAIAAVIAQWLDRQPLRERQAGR